MEVLLSVKNLRTSFFTYAGEVKAVDGVSLNIEPGQTVALVGESGCGKSVTALSIMRLLSATGKILEGSVWFNQKNLTEMKERELVKIRGNEISMIFQDPMTSLNPVLRIKDQLMESLIIHKGVTKQQAVDKALALMKMVGIPFPEERYSQYPHQFSGGMRQRIMIAMALSCEPKLLIADEPTTALDVTIQAQILELIKELQLKTKIATILITHDLGVVAGLCQKIFVMYAGKIVESGSLTDIFYQARHPYTLGLLKSIPRLDEKTRRKLVPIWGQPPDMLLPPNGCRFHPRCEMAMKICKREWPPEFIIEDGHQVSCWLLDSRAPME